MILTGQQIKGLEFASRELVEYIKRHFHPHVMVVVTPQQVEIFESSASFKVSEVVENLQACSDLSEPLDYTKVETFNQG